MQASLTPVHVADLAADKKPPMPVWLDKFLRELLTGKHGCSVRLTLCLAGDMTRMESAFQALGLQFEVMHRKTLRRVQFGIDEMSREARQV